MSERIRVRLKWQYLDKQGTYEDPPGKGTAWLDDDGPNFFQWEDGNYACDCNRGSMFGINENMPCGDTIEVFDLEIIPACPSDTKGDSPK